MRSAISSTKGSTGSDGAAMDSHAYPSRRTCVKREAGCQPSETTNQKTLNVFRAKLHQID
jgi:hypothetical protein